MVQRFHRHRLLALAVACLALPLATQSEQGDKKKPVDEKSAEKKAADQKKAKPEWPKIKPVRMSITRDKIPQLAHKKEATRTKARDTIVRYGVGTCPALIQALKPTQKPAVVAEVIKLLDKFVEPRFAPLLADAWTGTNAIRDRYILTTIRRMKLKGYVTLYAKASVHGDAEIRDIATFALATEGDIRALHPLFLLARDSWEDKNYEIREVLDSMKSEKAEKWLLERIDQGTVSDRLAILRLLHGIGSEKSVRAIAPLLSSKAHLIRAGAVNALRGIVDGDPPFRKLSVFQAIDEVKKWKARVGG